MTPKSKPTDSEIDITLDSVIEEIRERGRILTQRFNNSPKELFAQLRQLSEKHPEKMVGQLKVVAVPGLTPSPQVTDD